MSGWIGAWGTGGTATVTNLTVTGSEVISVNTPTDALRITQTGSGNALTVEDSVNPDATPFVVTADGRVGVGIQFPQSIFDVSGDGFVLPSFRAYGASAGNFPTIVRGRGTQLSPAAVQNSDSLGGFQFQGYDGANAITSAQINVAIDGIPSTNDMPGRIVFSTTADGASSPAERMRIDNAGNVYGTSGTTSMTNGFFYIPAAGGAPSGVPTAVAGRVPMYYDTTNNNFYIYNGAWKKILLA
jgi:hypothetical protein